MRHLFRIILQKRKHWLMIFGTFLAMGFLAVASQMEILSMGVLAKKGPEVFELFGPVKHGQLQGAKKLTKEQVDKRWDEIVPPGKKAMDQEDVSHFLSTVNRKGLLDRVIHTIDKWAPISGNPPYLALMVAIVALYKALCLFWHRLAVRFVAINISKDLRQDYFEHIQSLPMSFYQRYNIGSLSSRVVTDAFAIAEGINSTLINFFEAPFIITTTLILCFMISWKLSAMIFLGFPLILGPIIFIARKVKRVSKQLQKNQENFATILIEFLAGIQTVKVFAMENFSLKKYKQENERMASLERKAAKYDVSARPIVHTMGMFFLAGALIIGLYFFHMGLAEVLIYCGFLFNFYEPVKKYADNNMLIQRGAAAAERMDEVMSIKPHIDDLKNAEVLTTFKKSIEFKNVWFKYGDEWILKDFNLTINKGETVALVGPTGAGKSTIVQLLPRLYEVTKGEILFDGKPLQDYTQRSLREQIGFVPQKPFLFLGSVAENIAFGRSFTEQEIEIAAKKAHAKEFIDNLPEKYNSPLAEAGKNFSGGQQQRLAIARALCKKAPILVMDEATSSLDAISENHIKSAIHELRGEMTQIIIAHRLSTIEDADKIVYIDQGQKIAEGTRQELLEVCPPFKTMWEMLHRQTEAVTV